MAEEIPLGEIGTSKGKGAKGYIALGIAIGLVIGTAVGYYVNVGTLQYAYKLLSEAQSPPPDLYLTAYSPGKVMLLTGMGTPIMVQDFAVNEKFRYIGQIKEYKILVTNNDYIYVLKNNEIYSRLLVEGLITGVVMKESIYVAFNGGVVKLSVPDLVEEAVWKMEGVSWLYAIPEEGLLFALTDKALYVLDENLRVVKKYDAGGQRLFVGAYYFFVAKGGAVSSYDRTTGRLIATATVEGEVYDLRACRGILLAATSAKLYAFRVPDLSLIKTFDAAGIQLINDASCSLVYLVGDKTLYVVLVPSLNLHKAELTVSLDGLEVRTGALGVAATGAKRQVALACGG
jgi:hypothetical protein